MEQNGLDPHKEPYFLGTKEAAHLLGICEWTLRKWLGKKGGPPFRRVGRGRFYLPRNKLIEWANKTKEL